MAYTFSKTTPTSGAVALYDFKTQLKSAGWSVKSSGDATTFNSTGDQIASGASGATGLANTNAWFRIQSPDGYGEFTFQRGGTNLLWRIKYSRANHFTGGSPSATRTPSATDELILHGGGTDASPTYTTVFAADGSYRWNVGTETSSPYTFWACSIPTGGGASLTTIIQDYFLAAEPTDGNLYLIITCAAVNGLTTGATNINGQGRGLGSTVRTVTSLAAVTPTTAIDVAAMSYNSGATTIYPDAGVTNPISGKDEVFPILWARGSSVANPGYKGIGYMVKWVGLNRSAGDTLTINSTRDRIIIGSVSLPWDGSVPTI